MFFRPQKQSVGRSPHKSYKVTQMQSSYLPHLFIDTTKTTLYVQQRKNKYDDKFVN